jgi:hypothetical protein
VHAIETTLDTLNAPWCTPTRHPQGRWLPEADFGASVRFAAVAAAARAAAAAGRPKPLDGRMVVVQCPARATATTAAAMRGGATAAAAAAAGSGGGLGGGASGAGHRAAMQRLVRALGGRVCGARAADLCVVCGGGGAAAVPRELPAGARAVSEEWLLQLAETHTAPEVGAHALARG